MRPIKHISVWCDRPHFLIRWLVAGAARWVVVADGTQPNDGLPFGTIRDAKTWLASNGFSPVG